ncbi:type III-B CRISPR module RAMP protein Cmr6 [Marinobacterium iners]|uniref:type III-B CRISPR module RAMP protein Cmr6 n=1 Tax=Marinobacterium iners TaxID=48076 RepID=UPI001A8F3015|nr:type III-B CRISPR module RAMP protein Cmr6 [Marinobacterium iners]QSR34170.1 type III-B CRISPR module RAMP protein Cmr6 [Marinobacterium iners]
MLPLYNWQTHAIPSGEDAQRQIQHRGCHPGLWFERFFNQYDDEFAIRDTAKSSFIKGLAGGCGNAQALQQAYLRQSALVKACSGVTITLQADWHFATGLGNPHPVENGFLLHPTLAAPYLPGSSVKGLVRSWLEQNLGDKAGMLFHCLFGSEDKDPTKCQQDFQAGDVIFFDALPVLPATLLLDTMTPHMGGWYEKGGTEDVSMAANQPADWHDPVPVPFLAAKELVLMFSFAPRKRDADSDQLMRLVGKALQDALFHAGAGAKTAAGYGGFSTLDEKKQRELQQLDARLAEQLEEQRKAAQLAQLSPEAQVVEGLKEDAKKKENQTPGQSNDFLVRLKQALELAQHWPDDERDALLIFYNDYKKFISKKREKEFKALANALKNI